MTNSRRTWKRLSPPHVIWLLLLPTTLISGCYRKHIYAHGINLSIMHAELYICVYYIWSTSNHETVCGELVLHNEFVGTKIKRWETWASRGRARGRSVADNGGSAMFEASKCGGMHVNSCCWRQRAAMGGLPGVLSRKSCIRMQRATGKSNQVNIYTTAPFDSTKNLIFKYLNLNSTRI